MKGPETTMPFTSLSGSESDRDVDKLERVKYKIV